MDKLVRLLKKNSGIQYSEFHARKNQTLFFEGDECHKIGIVISGKINIVSYLDDGQEVVYNTLSKDEMFGNNLIFSSSPFYRGDVVALEETDVVYVEKEDLLKALSGDQEFLETYLMKQSDFSKKLNFKIKLLTIDSAKERIKYYLTFNKGKIEYKSITKLSKELYLTRETLSRTLYKMSRDNEIELANKTIVLK